MRTIIRQLPSRRDFLRGRYTLEIGYPWLTYGAIMALEGILKPDFKVLEFGCGGSTLFWSRRCGSVKSLDLSADWVERVRRALPADSNVELVCGDRYELAKVVRNTPDGYYDLALVDIGPHCRDRLMMARECGSKIRVGGYLVVDNYDSRFIRRFDYSGWDVYVFDDMTYAGRGTKIGVKKPHGD